MTKRTPNDFSLDFFQDEPSKLLGDIEKYLPKTVTERYRLIKEIGRGSYGIVFKALDIENNQFVAIKTLNKQNLSKSAQKLRHEYETAVALNHPNLISVREFIQDSNDHFCLIMDYIEGHSLLELIEYKGRMEPLCAVKIMIQLAEAVDYLHKNKFYHLDLKPENVLIDSQQKVLLIDFGTTLEEKELWDKEGKVFTTADYADSGSLVGLTREIDRITEVYSLGVILYEMLTGKGLSSYNTEVEVSSDETNEVQKAKEEKTKAFVSATLATILPLEFPDDIPQELCNVCVKCIKNKSSNCFFSASELAASLLQFNANFELMDRSEFADLEIRRKLLISWKIGIKLGQTFYYHIKHKQTLDSLLKILTEKSSSSYFHQLAMVIGDEILALKDLKEAKDLALNLNLVLDDVSDAKYYQMIYKIHSISVNEIKQLPELAENISCLIDKTLQDVYKHLQQEGDQFYLMFDVRFCAGLWNVSDKFTNRIQEVARKIYFPEECWNELLGLIESSPTEKSKDMIDRYLSNMDRCVEHYFLNN